MLDKRLNYIRTNSEISPTGSIDLVVGVGLVGLVLGDVLGAVVAPHSQGGHLQACGCEWLW